MDADNYELYEDFVRRLMARTPILHTRQLLTAMVNEFANEPMSPEFALNVVLPEVQRRGYIMMSESGWTMTSMMYRMLSDDRLSIGYNLHGPYKLNKKIDVFSKDSKMIIDSAEPPVLVSRLPCGRDRLDEIDAMWIVCDNMPESDDFISGTTPPWDAVFTTKPKSDENGDRPGKLIEITRIHNTSLVADIERLRALPPIQAKTQQAAMQRIAIVDDEDAAQYVPYIGFRFICRIDMSSPSGYRVIEKRSADEAWYECNPS